MEPLVPGVHEHVARGGPALCGRRGVDEGLSRVHGGAQLEAAVLRVEQQVRQLGVRQVLNKPFDPLQLASQLQQVWEAEHG